MHTANSSEAPPLTDISIRRNLKGTSQAEAQLTLVVTNNLPMQVSTGYLETMPWHLQFYLHTLRAHIDGTARGESRAVSLLLPFFHNALGPSALGIGGPAASSKREMRDAS